MRAPLLVPVALVVSLAAPSVAEARRTRRAPPLAGAGQAVASKSDEAVRAALDATPAGGTARLPYGRFRAAIVVDRPMTLVAHRRGTTLDATGLGRPAIEVLPGVVGVTVDGVHVAGADAEGVRVGDGADGVRLLRLTATACRGDGVRVGEVAGARVEECALDRNGGDGVEVGGDDAVVARCSFRENAGAGARLGGRDASLVDASFSGGAEGVVFDGLRPRAFRCAFRGVALVARFSPTADAAALERCDARGARTLALAEGGSVEARVLANRVAGTAGDAVVLEGAWHRVEGNAFGAVRGAVVVADGVSLRVADNVATSSGGDGVRVEGAGNTVEDNVLGPCAGDAVVVEGDANVVARNACRDGAGDGVVARGASNLVVANDVVGVGGAGIVLEGDASTVQDNRLRSTGEDGIVVASGRENRLVANSIQDCGGRGLDDRGTDTQLERNRID